RGKAHECSGTILTSRYHLVKWSHSTVTGMSAFGGQQIRRMNQWICFSMAITKPLMKTGLLLQSTFFSPLVIVGVLLLGSHRVMMMIARTARTRSHPRWPQREPLRRPGQGRE